MYIDPASFRAIFAADLAPTDAAVLAASRPVEGICCGKLMTGFGQAEDIQRASEAGFNHHLVKPVAAEALKELLDSRFSAN